MTKWTRRRRLQLRLTGLIRRLSCLRHGHMAVPQNFERTIGWCLWCYKDGIKL